MEASTHQECPSCGARVPVVAGFVTWCDACGWNLHAPKPEPPRTRFDRLYERAGRRMGERLVERLEREESLEPRLTPAKLAAYVLAALSHALTLALLLGGMLLLVRGFPNLFAIVIGALAVLSAFFMRPRFGKLPDDAVELARADAPELYGLVDRVAAAMPSRTADVIVVDHSYNASWGTVGLRRRRVLTLGLPLLAALPPDQRVAIVAHELAHDRNGDATRGLLVGSAISSLAALYSLLAPHDSSDLDYVDAPLQDRFVNVIFWILSRPLVWFLLLELHLALRDSQRAEFLADSLAARVAGTGATVGLHESLLLDSTVQGVLRRAAQGDRNMFTELAAAFANVPERERERRRRVARLEEARLESTHPPTGHRIRLLERRPPLHPEVVLGDGASARMDEELAPLHQDLQRRLVDEYRASLYDY